MIIHLFLLNSLLWSGIFSCQRSEKFIEITAYRVEDKIRGGLLGQLFGNLNGLPHEMRYLDEPGDVNSYTPALPEGAWSDDDTDIEWIYIVGMQQYDRLLLSPEQIAGLWREHINEGIWCSNLYARHLMNLGILPPLTGRIAINPWAVFNISGQFICESFGLIAPALPQTAARIGLNYTHVTIDGEPAQTTQLLTGMIATAFIENDVEKIIQAGLAAVDRQSEVHNIVSDVYGWWQANPGDWRKTRLAIKEKYSRYNGEMRDRNGYELNTAATISSLLYGEGDFSETLRYAFNFGWDADNNAATCGTIVGVIQGYTWMLGRGWIVDDIYKNVTRNGMPMDETITHFGDRLIVLARKVVEEAGGKVTGSLWQIPFQNPANVEPLPRPLDRMPELQLQLRSVIIKDLRGGETDRARAVYLGIALGNAKEISTAQPIAWQQGIESLKNYPQVIKNIFDSPGPFGEKLIQLAQEADLKKPQN